MRSERGWADVTIRDVSSRGMLLSSEKPPCAGGYLEICSHASTLVGRIVWVNDHDFGITIRERIDVDLVMREGRWRLTDPPAFIAPPRPHRPVDTHALSREHAARFEFAVLLLAGLVVSVLIALLLYGLLAPHFQMIAQALGSGAE